MQRGLRRRSSPAVTGKENGCLNSAQARSLVSSVVSSVVSSLLSSLLSAVTCFTSIEANVCLN
jgi:hypothetical protein